MRVRRTVVLLTVLWVLAVGALYLWRFAIGFGGWAEHFARDGGTSTATRQHFALLTLALVAVAAGGPLVIGWLAIARRAVTTGVVYLALATVMVVLAVAPAKEAYQTLTPGSPAATSPGICQEHSGGDSRCPGG